MAHTLLDLTGTYENLDGTPAEGTVTFTLSKTTRNEVAPPMTVTPTPIRFELVNGAIPSGAQIYATNDPTTRPVDAVYVVDEDLRAGGGDRRSYRTIVPYDSTGGVYDTAQIRTPSGDPWSPSVDGQDLLVAIGNATAAAQAAAAAAADALQARIQPGRAIGARIIGFGDSKMAGLIDTSVTAGPLTDGRPNYNAWFERMCASNPHWFYRIRNAGSGGDTFGGLGVVRETALAGQPVMKITMTAGNFPFGANILTIGGTGEPGAVVMTRSSSTAPVGNDFDITFTGNLASTWPAGSEVGWGGLGRIHFAVIDWAPEMCLLDYGTNELGQTAERFIARAIVEDGCELLRDNGIEPIIVEQTPRTVYFAEVQTLNDWLHHYARNAASGPINVLPVHQAFAGATGLFASVVDSADGLHLTPAGNKKMANLVASQLVDLGLRKAKVPMAASNADPTNLVATNACFADSVAVGTPAGWTLVTTTGAVVAQTKAPAADDPIIGNWFSLTADGVAAVDVTYRQDIAGVAAGDRLLKSCWVRSIDLVGNYRLTVQFESTFFTDDLIFELNETDFDGVAMQVANLVNNVAASRMKIRVQGSIGATGEFQIGMVYAQNLTTLGRNP